MRATRFPGRVTIASLKLMADHSTRINTSPAGRSSVAQFDDGGTDHLARLRQHVGREAHRLTVEAVAGRSGAGAVAGYVRTVVLTTADYGHWPSPLTAGEVAGAKISLAELCSDGAALYWLESRPEENGRVVFVRADAGGRRDHSPAGVSIRSRVHEYGGGAVCLVPGGSAGAFAYVDQADQRVWFCAGRADEGGASPRALSRAGAGGHGVPPRRAQRHGRRRLGARGAGGAPRTT